VETGHWTQLQWSEYEAGEQTRRCVEIKDLAKEPLAPHKGVDGFLQHWRRGLIGAVQSWARGCKTRVVNMLMTLIRPDHGGARDDTIFEMSARVDEQIRGGCWLGVGVGRRAVS
jgi:hypothetical protein